MSLDEYKLSHVQHPGIITCVLPRFAQLNSRSTTYIYNIKEKQVVGEVDI